MNNTSTVQKNLDIDYSIVIPVFNEGGNIVELYTRLSEVMKNVTGQYEIIFVNDGSTDNSFEVMRRINDADTKVKILNFSRNFGHQIALSAGLDFANGKAVIVMDGDSQDPPEVIPRLIERWEQGYDVVYAVRKKRKEILLKRVCYRLFYFILRKIADVNIPLDSGDFGLMDKKVVDLISCMPERNKFIRGLRSWVGFNQCGIEYERSERLSGKTKYTFTKLLRLAADGLVSFSFVPLRLVLFIGIGISSCSFLLIIIFVYLKIVKAIPVRGFTALAVIVLFLGGTILIALGVIGEYIGRIYDEVKRRPLYLIKDVIGFNSNH